MSVDIFLVFFWFFGSVELHILVNRESDDSIKLLNKLRIWNESLIPGGLPGWLLFKVFRDGVRTSMMGG